MNMLSSKLTLFLICVSFIECKRRDYYNPSSGVMYFCGITYRVKNKTSISVRSVQSPLI